MSQANELLDSLTTDEIAAYSTDSTSEPHIVIGSDRYITVPESLKRIGVQFDHNVETVTFDCPRYWDGLDMSKMIIYINYLTPGGVRAAYIAENVSVDETDDTMMHFTWTISNHVTMVKGTLSFLVCIKKTDGDGNEVNHWNSELNREMFISEGMECQEVALSEYPDIITQLLTRMTTVENISVTADAMQNLYDSTFQVASAANDRKNEILELQAEINNSAAEIRNSYANAIKGKASGEIVQVNDVSPLEHDVNCLVHGKNLFDISKVTTTDLVTNNEDGTLTIAAGAYYARLSQKLSDLCPGLKPGDVATFSATTDSSYSKYIYLHGLGRTWNMGATETMNEEILNSYVCFYGYTETDPLYGQENILSNIQIEKGNIATEYESYIDPSTVTVTRYGKNLIDVDAMLNTQLTKSGDIYTFKKGTNTDDRFTNTVPVYIPADTEICMSAIFEDYTVTDGTLYMIFTYADGTKAFPSIAFKEKEKYRYIRPPKAVVSIQFYIQGTQEAGSYIAFRKMQLEIGETPTEYESYDKDESTVEADGICSVKSFGTNMVIYTNTIGTIIEAEYNRDTTKMFESYVITDEVKAEIAELVKAELTSQTSLVDTKTGKTYELYVYDGKLMLAESEK